LILLFLLSVLLPFSIMSSDRLSATGAVVMAMPVLLLLLLTVAAVAAVDGQQAGSNVNGNGTGSSSETAAQRWVSSSIRAPYHRFEI
jgi:hypothetical protein